MLHGYPLVIQCSYGVEYVMKISRGSTSIDLRRLSVSYVLLHPFCTGIAYSRYSVTNFGYRLVLFFVLTIHLRE